MLAVLQWGVQAPKGHDDASCIQSATEKVVSCHHYTVQGAHCNACKLKESNIWWTCPLLEGLFVTTSSFAQTDTFYVCILHLSSSFSSKLLLNSQLRTNNGFIVLLTTSKHVTCLKPWDWHLNHWRRHPHSPIPSLPNSASCKHPETSEAPFPTQKPRAGPNVPWHPGAGDLFLRSHLTKQGENLPVCMGSKFNKSTTVPQFHVVKFWLLSVLLSLLLPLLFFCTRGRTSMSRNPRSCAASAGWAHPAACQSATNVLTAGNFTVGSFQIRDYTTLIKFTNSQRLPHPRPRNNFFAPSKPNPTG